MYIHMDPTPIKSRVEEIPEVTLTEFLGNSFILCYCSYHKHYSHPQQLICNNPLLQSVYFRFVYSWIWQTQLLYKILISQLYSFQQYYIEKLQFSH